MIPKDGLNPKYFAAVLRRRLWYVVLPFFLISLGSVVYCIKTPKLYKSSTLILIQPQEVPDDYVQPLVKTDARSRLNTLGEQVMSRPRLEKVIKKYDLYPEIRKSATMYDAVQMMREHISVGVRARGRGASPASFEVSFTGYDPVKVRNVTTAIANLFIDYNLKFREKLAAGTTQFLERELERMREELRQKEERVRQFKTKYMGMLPEHMESNYRMLDQLQQQMASLNDTLQQIEDRKVLLREQQGRTENRQVDPQTPLTIDQLHQQLKSLESRYTDKHPDVIRLAAAIARIEEEQKKGNVKMSASSPGQGEAPQRQMMLVQREDLLSQLKLLDKQSQKLNEEKKQVSMAMEGYRRRIETGPKLEQVYVDLRRDYQQVDNNYQSLLQKKLQAEMAENLERTQKGEQFTILDPANLPEKPFKPNVPRIFLLSLVLALGCGFGLAVLRDYLDQTFWEWKELESFLQLPVLAAVPFINPGQERSPNMFKKAFAVCMVVSMASVLFYALLVLWGKSPMLFFI